MISIENASLESMLGELLGALLGIFPRIGHTLYFTPKAVLARLEMLENVLTEALEHDPASLAKVAAVVKRSRAIMGKRNDIMHSLWAISEEPGAPAARILFPSWRGGDVPLAELTDIYPRLPQSHRRDRRTDRRSSGVLLGAHASVASKIPATSSR